jgi:2-haloacid dehalogenase
MRPTLLTFDVFGTVLDWRAGLTAAVRAEGLPFDDAAFDRVIEAQGRDEQAGYRSYRSITARSLVKVLGLDPARADAIGAGAGRWPLYPDAAAALARLQRLAPCVAMTNSDRDHGEDVQAQLGFALSGWLCAEEVRLYKPDPRFWHEVSRRRGVPFGPSWWHVSAYGDYDLEQAAKLGLTGVFVERPHATPGPCAHRVGDLAALAALVEAG